MKLLIKLQTCQEIHHKILLETVESEIEVPEERYISPGKNIENYRWFKIIIMEYQEIINLLDSTRKQPSEVTTKKLVWNKWWFTWNI